MSRRATAVARPLLRRLHEARGLVRGRLYRAIGGHRVTDVGDGALTQRVRSVVEQTTKALDRGSVHLSVDRRVVLLHGQVGSAGDADAIERAVGAVEGVEGVLSWLHVGPAPAPSPALRRLVAAAEAANVPSPVSGVAVRAVLATFVERLPADAQAHLLAHLPRDVQALASPPHRCGSVGKVRRFDDFIAAVLTADDRAPVRAGEVAVAVLAAMQEIVPEERRQIAAVLPSDLRGVRPEPAPAAAT